VNLLVFSDLDGTLLDHDTYAFDAAGPALARLRELRVPLVLATSKTRAEVEPVRAQLCNDDPFIVENGGGIFFRGDRSAPDLQGVERRGDYWCVRCGVDYRTVRAFITEVAARFGAGGFGDMTDEQVAYRTGLPLDAARRARRREFTEPFVLEDEGVLPDLARAAADAGLALTRGGRFHHLIGAAQDKGKAVRLVIDALAGGERVRSIGLGDGDNDRPMLAAVDVAVVVPRPDGTCLRLPDIDARYAPLPGSRGWNAAVLSLIDDLDR
jgi:mannosyl-3-phosphoglycerate phosphatase